jgi:HK97 family phage portal protein
MKWPWTKVEKKDTNLSVLKELIAAQQGTIAGVDPQSCMRSPTVHALVTAISRRIAVTPVHVYKGSMKGGIETRKKIEHPVSKILSRPNIYQTRFDYWQDAASTLVRHGRYYAFKHIGNSGPLTGLDPLDPSAMVIEKDSNFRIIHKYDGQEINSRKIHMVRGPARDFINGDSPVKDVAMAIALEIAAEHYGAQFFQNGAIPLIIFKYLQGAKGFKTPEDEKAFISAFQQLFSGDKRHRAMMLPPGMETGQINIENDKAQFLETKKHQRTVIAGAFGVPPHLVGDLERGTFNNVEQQDKDFTLNVIMPYVMNFEAAMERDLLSDDDRSHGVVIRFNLDAVLRANFKERQEGLQIQLMNGVISPNEWREIEKKNPIDDDDGGNTYYRSANYIPAGEIDEQQIDSPLTDKDPEQQTV